MKSPEADDVTDERRPSNSSDPSETKKTMNNSWRSGRVEKMVVELGTNPTDLSQSDVI